MGHVSAIQNKCTETSCTLGLVGALMIWAEAKWKKLRTLLPITPFKLGTPAKIMSTRAQYEKTHTNGAKQEKTASVWEQRTFNTISNTTCVIHICHSTQLSCSAGGARICETKWFFPHQRCWVSFHTGLHFILMLEYQPEPRQRRALLRVPLADKRLWAAQESCSFCRCSYSSSTARATSEWELSQL